MTIQFQSSVLFVKDIAASRRFYEKLLGQTVDIDFGPNVGFKGFSIWQIDHASEMIFERPSEVAGQLGHKNFEQTLHRLPQVDVVSESDFRGRQAVAGVIGVVIKKFEIALVFGNVDDGGIFGNLPDQIDLVFSGGDAGIKCSEHGRRRLAKLFGQHAAVMVGSAVQETIDGALKLVDKTDAFGISQTGGPLF